MHTGLVLLVCCSLANAVFAQGPNKITIHLTGYVTNTTMHTVPFVPEYADKSSTVFQKAEGKMLNWVQNTLETCDQLKKAFSASSLESLDKRYNFTYADVKVTFGFQKAISCLPYSEQVCLISATLSANPKEFSLWNAYDISYDKDISTEWKVNMQANVVDEKSAPVKFNPKFNTKDSPEQKELMKKIDEWLKGFSTDWLDHYAFQKATAVGQAQNETQIDLDMTFKRAGDSKCVPYEKAQYYLTAIIDGAEVGANQYGLIEPSYK